MIMRNNLFVAFQQIEFCGGWVLLEAKVPHLFWMKVYDMEFKNIQRFWAHLPGQRLTGTAST